MALLVIMKVFDVIMRIGLGVVFVFALFLIFVVVLGSVECFVGEDDVFVDLVFVLRVVIDL